MKTFIFKKKLPIWKLILGVLALIVGIVSIFTTLKGFVIIGMGVFFLLVEGSEFNFTNRSYRTIKSFLGLNFGKWGPLPNIEYVSVFKTTETTTIRERSAEANVKNNIIKLNLFYDTNQKIEVYVTYDIEDDFKKAHELASLLNVDILDATERESKWL
ncbi:MAG: hypothetical protein HRU49_12045 [Winogradskyella sp.]|uniref:hypothetical protein n=1 Tax=Winogradskyella sp. TaxID=1883156 RepID=UPI0025F654EE|nr:hypothetical protein [Winogradskyella sp.]NRB84488.1 hypothetical protein [Winogradskyella sp.]